VLPLQEPEVLVCSVPVVAVIEVREAVLADLPQIAAVALATGQEEEWGGADPAYMTHLLAHGTVVVPREHGSGCGRAMLAELWPGGGRRMTFSSLHGHALPLYTSFGLDAWWPLLYLRGRVDALPAPPGWRAEAATAAEVAARELAWSGVDRSDDHRAWARRPGGAGVLVRRDGQVLAAGTVGGAGGEYGVTHLALAPSAGGTDSAAALLTVLAGLEPEEPEDGRARVCLPGPHPAVRALLAAGWRVEEFDLFMATEPDLLDPRRAVPSPALA